MKNAIPEVHVEAVAEFVRQWPGPVYRSVFDAEGNMVSVLIVNATENYRLEGRYSIRVSRFEEAMERAQLGHRVSIAILDEVGYIMLCPIQKVHIIDTKHFDDDYYIFDRKYFEIRPDTLIQEGA